VLVLAMGEPVKIVDVARRLIDESGREIEIEYTGLRQGEKLHEVLLSTVEHGVASEHPLITRVAVPPLPPSELLQDTDEHEQMWALLRSAANPSANAVPHVLAAAGGSGPVALVANT